MASAAQRRNDMVARAMRWQDRDGSVLWDGRRRRFRQIDQAPKFHVAAKGHRPGPPALQEPIDMRSGSVWH